MKKLSSLFVLAALGLFPCLGCGDGKVSNAPVSTGTAEEVDPAKIMGMSEEEMSKAGAAGAGPKTTVPGGSAP